MAPVLIALAALVAWPEEHVQRTASAEGLGSGEFWLPIEYSTLSGWRVADSEPLPPFEQMPDPPVVTDLFHSHRVVLRNASIQVLFRALGG